MSEAREIYFTKIGNKDAMSTQEACNYLGISYYTLRNRLAQHQEIGKYSIGKGNKHFLFKEDVDRLKQEADLGIVVDIKAVHAGDFHFIDVGGKQALNLQQSAGYLGITYSALQKKLKKYPDVKKHTCRSDTREKYLLRDDLDRMKEFHVEE